MSIEWPFISVVIPFYNVADYLREAVESVRKQSYGNWEILLVDDGSVDGSSTIAAEFAAKDTRVTCIRHPDHANLGASASRNRGLAAAKGEYVAFLDSDDVWVPDKLAHQVKLLEEHPAVDMICGASLYWASWAGRGGVDRVFEIGCPQNQQFQPPELAKMLYPLGKGNAPSMNGLLVRRTVVEEVGGFVKAFKGMYDDQTFLTKLYLRSPVYVTSKIYDKYRQNRPGSVCYTSRSSGDYLYHRGSYMRWLKSYLAENEAGDREIRKLLIRESFKCRFPRSSRCIGRLRRQPKKLKSAITSAVEILGR